MKKNKIFIQNFWYVNNYGACLTAYALYKILENLGNDVSLIDVSNFQESISYKFKPFINKYCKTTNRIKSFKDLQDINLENAIYITGSDQVFRPHLVKNKLKYFLFDYINEKAKKVSFSASFGVTKEKFLKETSPDTVEQMKKSLHSFDAISVREKHGIDICNEIFNINAEWIIDPVFILDKSYFNELAEKSSKKFDNKIVSCVFDKKNNKIDKFLQKKYNAEVIEMWGNNLAIEEWLAAIKNCKFLITNSFHATCFAIIFNKPFICLAKDMGASPRFESLFELLGLNIPCINNINEIYQKDCIINLDYEKVNPKISQEAKKFLAFWEKICEIKPSHIEEKKEIRTRFLETRLTELEEETKIKNQIKKCIWNTWIIIFNKLPKFIQNIIRNIKGIIQNAKTK